MIHHLVMWTITADSCISKTEVARQFKEKVESLATIIPGIIELRVGIGIDSPSSNYDLALHSVFVDEQALGHYQQHEAHQAFVAWGKNFLENRACVDYRF